MVDVVTLDLVKAQLSLEADETDDDALLGGYMPAAVRLGVKLTGGVSPDTMEDDDLALFRVGVLQTIAHWYANRESVSIGQSLKTDEVPQSAGLIFEMIGGVSFA